MSIELLFTLRRTQRAIGRYEGATGAAVAAAGLLRRLGRCRRRIPGEGRGLRSYGRSARVFITVLTIIVSCTMSTLPHRPTQPHRIHTQRERVDREGGLREQRPSPKTWAAHGPLGPGWTGQKTVRPDDTPMRHRAVTARTSVGQKRESAKLAAAHSVQSFGAVVPAYTFAST